MQIQCINGVLEWFREKSESRTVGTKWKEEKTRKKNCQKDITRDLLILYSCEQDAREGPQHIFRLLFLAVVFRCFYYWEVYFFVSFLEKHHAKGLLTKLFFNSFPIFQLSLTNGGLLCLLSLLCSMQSAIHLSFCSLLICSELFLFSPASLSISSLFADSLAYALPWLIRCALFQDIVAPPWFRFKERLRYCLFFLFFLSFKSRLIW